MKKYLLLLCALGMLSQAGAVKQMSKVLKPDLSGPFVSRTVDKESEHPRFDTRADENTLMFTYCQGDIGLSLTTQTANVTLGGAIIIPAEKAQAWKGAKLTSVRIGFGQSSNLNVTVFISNVADNLPGTPFYTQETTLQFANDWNDVELDTPYEITGEEFAIGYTTTTKSRTDAPIGMDGYYSFSPYAGFVGVENRGEIGWWDATTQYGSLCFEIILEGDNLPLYDANIYNIDFQEFAELGNTFDATFTIRNEGINTIDNIKVTGTVGGKEVPGLNVQLYPASLESMESGTVMVSGLVSNIEGWDVPIVLTLTQIDGNDDQNPTDNVVSGEIIIAEEGFDRNVLIEEGTGTWCGWCPRGIVGMEYMKEHYGDDGFIGIAVHVSTQGAPDPMQVNSYLKMVQVFFEGFPSAVVDRKYLIDPSVDEMEYYYNYMKRSDAPAEVTFDAVYPGANGGIDVNATAMFALPQEKSSFKLAFAIKEDGMGPYNQTNYYSTDFYMQQNGTYPPTLEGWNDKAYQTPFVFNEVGREIVDPFGINNSLPASIERNTPYTYSTTIPVTNVKNIDNCSVVAMILDASNYTVVNSASVRLNGASVEGIGAENPTVKVSATEGGIFIKGEYSDCMVYTTDGAIVNSARAIDFIALNPGLYIVRATGVNGDVITEKVLVK